MRTTTKPFTALTAADLMTREVLAIPKQMSLRAAARLLSRARVTGAPVVDDAGVCVGVLSATDFLRWAEGASGVRAEARECFCADWQVVEVETLPEDAVGARMTREPVLAPPSAAVGELARIMLAERVHRLVVVDGRGRPVGVLSTTDILGAVAEADAEERAHAGEPAAARR
jgi:CBS domain-containing membrane protein